MEAKLLSYIAALTLHIDNFSVDITVIALDLKMEPKLYAYSLPGSYIG